MPEFTGAIDFAGDTDQFNVFLAAGVRYYIELEGSATGAGNLADPIARLLFNGVQVAFDDDGGVGLNSRIVFTPGVSGVYTVDVSEFLNNDTGTYRLRVFDDDFKNSFEGNGFFGSLTPGVAVSGILNYAGDTDQYGVNLIAGRQYIIDAEGSPTGGGTLSDTLISLQQNGVQIAVDDDGGRGFNSRIVFTPTTSGFYTVEARDFGNNDAGTFRLRVAEDEFRNTAEGVGPQGTAITGGASVAGNLNYAGDADIFGTSLINGLTYTVEQRGSATGEGTLADPRLFILNSFDTVLADDDDSGVGFNAREVFTAAFTGTHFIQARDFGDNNSGTYRVQVSAGVANNLNNNIIGTAAADGVIALGGNDTVNLGAGNDTMTGGQGRDVLVGGVGDDRFDYNFTSESNAAARDLISGFDFGSAVTGDKIDLNTIDANTLLFGNQNFSLVEGTGLGQISFVDLANGHTLIRGNTSIAAGFELQIEVADGATTAGFWSTSLDLIV
jgi:hypothetical protein